jgi:hypothetical protein
MRKRPVLLLLIATVLAAALFVVIEGSADFLPHGVGQAVGALMILLGTATAVKSSKRIRVRVGRVAGSRRPEGFGGVDQACTWLSAASRIWLSNIADRGRRTAVTVSRDRFYFAGGRAPAWCLHFNHGRVYFLPGKIVIRGADQYQTFSYAALRLTCRPTRFIERSTVPPDAQIVGSASLDSRRNGSADWRYTSSRRVPVVIYGVVELGLGGAFAARLIVSDRKTAALFVQQMSAALSPGFGAVAESRPAANTQAPRNTAPAAEPLNKLAALGLLGLPPGATARQIAKAYHRRAQIYHPDKVHHLAQEFRQMAELRMREINAAYDMLKRS